MCCIALLAGCGTTWQQKPPPSDWPPLSTTTVIVDSESIFTRLCGPAPPGFVKNGCAIINAAFTTCTIVLAKRRYNRWTIDEEEGHCRGIDHPGEDTLKKAWEKHRRLARLKERHRQSK